MGESNGHFINGFEAKREQFYQKIEKQRTSQKINMNAIMLGGAETLPRDHMNLNSVGKDGINQQRKDANSNSPENDQDYFRVSKISEFKQMNPDEDIVVLDEGLRQQIEKLEELQYKCELIGEYLESIKSQESPELLKVLIAVKKILTSIRISTKKLHQYGAQGYFHDQLLMKRIMHLASSGEYSPQINYLATKIIAELVQLSTESNIQFQDSISNGLVEFLQKEINNKDLNHHSLAQICITIINLSSFKQDLTNQFVEDKCVDALIQIIKRTEYICIVEKAASVLIILVRKNAPMISLDQKIKVVTFFCKMIKNGLLLKINYRPIYKVLGYILTQFSKTSQEMTELLLQERILPNVLEYLKSDFEKVQIGASCVIYCFTLFNEKQRRYLVDQNFFAYALHVLNQGLSSAVKQNRCRALINLLQLNSDASFIDKIDLLDKLAEMFDQVNIRIRCLICYIYSRYSEFFKTKETLEMLLYYDVIRMFVNMLHQGDAGKLIIITQGILRVLELGDACKYNDSNLMLEKLIQYGGDKIVEQLQFHEDEQVQGWPIEILIDILEAETTI